MWKIRERPITVPKYEEGKVLFKLREQMSTLERRERKRKEGKRENT